MLNLILKKKCGLIAIMSNLNPFLEITVKRNFKRGANYINPATSYAETWWERNIKKKN